MKVKVWNDNTHPHKEMFRGDLITIPAKSYIFMEQSDAHEFRTQFYPLRRSEVGEGNMDPTSLKMIRIEKIVGEVEEPKPEVFKSPLTGKVFASKALLDAHLEANKGKVVVDEEIEREIAAAQATKPKTRKKSTAA
jgi:hypothetical protein